MEDGLAREGVLARCGQDPEASKSDVECDNARRAAAAIAAADAGDERQRSADLARQSERKMLAMRERDSQAQKAEAQAAADARAQSDADYEAQWRAQNAAGRTASANDVTDYDFVPVRPTLQVAAVAPPKSELTIVAPELKSSDVAIVPRPFRAADDD